MKIVIVSDSHLDVYPLEELLSIYSTEVDGFFHCGDSELSENHPIWEKMVTVEGNMDFPGNFPLTYSETIENNKIFMTHGHMHQIKLTFDRVIEEANKEKATIILYGHTHIPRVDIIDNKIMINPGSISQPRGEIRSKTYCILEVLNNQGKVTYFDNNHDPIPQLSSTFVYEK
ncbi:YfcE family phosphodiesterase [Lacticigenium naphthae]|uniref:YfcE family phosphodiesterase n=1 Tax=Lacticigenium naphthae TaxID=515351 RepID=UPI0003F72921|nr:metallophosphoesterase [Lacticigenium naphthae]